MEAATQMLKRAVELDTKKSFSEAKVCYEEGIELLLKSLNTVEPSAKAEIRKKITAYMNRAEELKEYIRTQKKVGKFHEQIKINDGQKGCSYISLFSKYIDENLTSVEIYDAYIRAHHQILNLLRFIEFLVRKAKKLSAISLITGRDEQKFEEQDRKLNEIMQSLKEYGITMKYEYSDTLHDREIYFNNGWIIKIGRGLDYFKSTKGKLSLGHCDMNFRDCHETVVDIYKS